MLAAILVLLLAGGASPAAAAFNMSNIFGDFMVIQREEPFAVWGWGCVSPVTTLFNGTKYSTTPDPNTGLWLQPLPSTPGGFTAYTLVFTCGGTGETLTLQHVLFGDVFFFFGQR
jgi:sialate O-acetylesterase